MLKKIKKYIPNNLKSELKSYFEKDNIYGDLSANKRKIFIVISADYGNLGDVAISYAQYKFLLDNFPDCEVIDAPISKTFSNIRKIKKIIKSNDVITIVGGGNFSNKYQSIEDLRLKWIKNFPYNKIICFPQTMDFTIDPVGMKSLKKSKKIIEKHENICLFARETVSYSMMKNKLNTKVELCPDIVLSLDKSSECLERNGVLSCIRKDQESIFSDSERECILNLLKNEFKEKIIFSDTHINRNNLSWFERINELDEIWNSFRQSKVVVTDRLHGMIFSVITKTPCVVIANNNHKIKTTYNDWLSDLNHIILLDSEDELVECIKKLYKMKEVCHSPSLNQYYSLIKEIILCE